MTYLQLVNNVLKRLRERTVSTVNENTYSTLIGIFINDAKDEVENAWKWSALRTTLSSTTEDGIFAYSLSGAGGIFEMLNVYNDTENFYMDYMEADKLTDLMLANPDHGCPRYYSYNGIDANGDAIVDLYPIPDGAYEIRFNMIKRTQEMEADGDTNFLPDHPLLMLAYAKAVEERGEDLGVSASSAYAAAQKHLADYISIDSARHPEELVWKSV